MQAWVTCAGFTASTKVFETQDGGAHWTNISYDLPNLPLNIIKQLPGTIDNQLVVGTDIGVYIKGLSENHWTAWSTGLPNVIVCDLEFNAANKKLYAATFGRAIWSMTLPDSLMLSTNPEFATTKNLQVFPSPAKASSIINIKTEVIAGSLELFDMQGKLIFNRVIEASQVDVLELRAPEQPGIYLIRINSANGQQDQKLLVY
jgi:hypothetical protein